MGRPLEKTDCDELAYFVHRQNAICSMNFLEALRANHGDLPCSVEATVVENLPVRELPPIPNSVIADAVNIAFGSGFSEVEKIIKAVSLYTGVSIEMIKSDRRDVKIVRPRQYCYYLAKKLTAASFPAIARKMNRDHTSLIVGVRKIDQLRLVNEKVEADLQAIAAMLGGELD